MLLYDPLVPQIVLLILALFFALYSFWLGTCIARLIRYNGALGPPYKRYNIVPQYLKDRYAAARENNNSRMSNRTHFPGITEPESTENLTEEEIRAAIAEEERIARLPTFVQDDCGDGDEFPGVPFADHVAALEPEPHPSFRAEPPNYMQMGLQKLNMSKWLTVDNTYKEFHEARLELLETKKNEVLQVSAEGEAACEELMWEVVNFLTETYPALYEILESGRGRRIWNKFVNEEYALEKPWDIHPLEVCARLAMEDFNILAKSEFSGQHHL